jgi:hypothetical protein
MGLESLELILAVEDEFGIRVPEERAQEMETVRDLYDYIVGTLVAAGPGISKPVPTPVLMAAGVALVIGATILVCVAGIVLLDARSALQKIVGVLVGAAIVGIPVLLVLWLTDITRDTATRKKWLRQSGSREQLGEKVQERLVHRISTMCRPPRDHITLDSRFVDDLKFG